MKVSNRLSQQRSVLISTLIFLIIAHTTNAFIDPFSIAVGSAAIGGISWGYNYYNSEKCTDYWIPMDVVPLGVELQKDLFGQHIVYDQVIRALVSHIRHLKYSRKPLIMSFHGTPGVGKNFVADKIAKALYRKGLESRFVHKFSGRLHFSEEGRAVEYSRQLRELIPQYVRDCERSLFIFDEVDSMPKGVFDTITALFDHHERIDGVDFRKSIFIFLSNHGGVELADKLYDLYRNKHLDREETNMQHYEKVLELAVFNKVGGLQHAKSIENSLIDHYVPFLPLEKRHVHQCIEAEFRRLGRRPSEEEIQSMFEIVTFEKNLFAKNGCKRLTKKAEIFAA